MEFVIISVITTTEVWCRGNRHDGFGVLYSSSIFAVSQEGRSSVKIAEIITSEVSGQRGFSAQSIRRFCADHGFFKTSRLPDARLESEVANAVAEVVMNDNLVFLNFDCLILAYSQVHKTVLTIIILIF